MKNTYIPRAKHLTRNWHLIDAGSAPLGRLATRIATLLVGKHKPGYTPHLDMGDYVVVTGASFLVLTGRKLSQKLYHRHSGYPGGYRELTAKALLAKDPAQLVRHAVRGMLPKNKLQAPRLARLKIYSGAEHPHENHFTHQKG